MIGNASFCRPASVAAAVLLWGIGAGVTPSVAAADGRVALVVGNSAYAAIGELPNPGNDAADVAAALGRLGFDVTTVSDADRAGLNEALRLFARESAGADVSLVFYAGHGIEVDGVNYLVPVDARLERDTDVEYEALPLDRVLRATTGAELRVVILDACRNNPLARSMQRTSASRSVSRGSFGELNEALLGDETLVAYAAAAGTTAADGTGRNSPYTAALLSYLERPLEIGILFREVRARVLASTGGEQRPHEYASLLGEHYLRGTSGPETVTAAAAVSGEAETQQETVFWQSISASRNPADFEAYLEQFPNGVFARLVRNRMAELAAGPADPPTVERPRPDRPGTDHLKLLALNTREIRTFNRDDERTGIWEFEGEAGQRVLLNAYSGDFDTTVSLVSPAGERVAYDDDGGYRRNSRLRAVLPVSGRYQVIVAPYGSGRGTYEVEASAFSGPTVLLTGRDYSGFQPRCPGVWVVSNVDLADFVVNFGSGAVLRNREGAVVRRFDSTTFRRNLFDDVCEHWVPRAIVIPE